MPGPGFCGPFLRYASAATLLVVLTCSVIEFATRRANEVDFLEQKLNIARKQSLHYGENYFEKYFGDPEDSNHFWWCGHYFKSLCRTKDRDATPWFRKTDWLDYSSRLKVCSQSVLPVTVTALPFQFMALSV